MYELSIQRDFIAQHFLIGGDWGAENQLHSHHYKLEVRISAPELNEHGYLLDIVDFSEHLEGVVDQYQDRTLNDLPEFEGLNPSIEHFARIVCLELGKKINVTALTALSVKIWENESAWAEYRVTF